jgi:DEAD/DEAH box helicase domain-containing protein
LDFIHRVALGEMVMENNNYIVFDIETTGLNAWYGDRVTCICAKDSNGAIFTGTLKEFGDYEKDLICAFSVWIEKKERKDFKLVSHSGKGFDVPFICARDVLTSSSTQNIPVLLLKREHFDLQDIPDYRISLNNLAKLFKCESKSGTGLQAIKLYEWGRWKELVDYCLQDINVTEQVYLKYQNLKCQ